MTTTAKEALTQRITAYLSGGGLFNPEMANHDAVRDLLIDVSAALAEQQAEPEKPTWPSDFALESLFDAAHSHGEFGRGFREHARQILAEQQAEPSADAPPEIGWLIEQEFGGGWLYWSGAFDTAIRHERKYLTAEMVRDPSEALRFARREDAQRALDGLLKADPCPVFRYAPEMYRVAEHQWG